MKYLVLIYSNPASRALWEDFDEERRSEGLALYAALNEDLAASGELVVNQALADPALTKRVTVAGGQVLTTDGPFAEAKELLAGFYLLECDSLERAVEVAARIPEASMGLVEVRPVLELAGLEM